eukprot:CAMPEP_0173403676 /NCGR_PEP_ID=MMETSP1356-20130122/57371_1 /TAXON_ID=77927 ORGANISM="Hemiselmis virescens, Strain PCC157" /NCGR_SAMPLE_ID=MMETSP1356 /ASSEMBLY_ACC=CAM_ASM_000847 /LENGTH=108 /DNA_ID=CAMNT_0014364231 /DNA_START=14 /DNA_END=336 /DNA_ORIENTATION=+
MPAYAARCSRAPMALAVFPASAASCCPSSAPAAGDAGCPEAAGGSPARALPSETTPTAVVAVVSALRPVLEAIIISSRTPSALRPRRRLLRAVLRPRAARSPLRLRAR